MSEDQNSGMDGEKPKDESESGRRSEPSWPQRLQGISGYLMLCGSLALVYLVSRSIGKPPAQFPREGTSDFFYLLHLYGIEILLTVAALAIGFWGTRLIGASGNEAPPSVIPDDDRGLLEPLITGGKHDSIRQYVLVSSLTGLTGTFQKIGFSGLPLATVVLTLIFCGLYFLDPAGGKDFLELAKLTTGAFIGSFVQKGQGAASGVVATEEAVEAFRRAGRPT